MIAKYINSHYGECQMQKDSGKCDCMKKKHPYFEQRCCEFFKKSQAESWQDQGETVKARYEK
jgi:hypothetical protein